MPDSLSLVRRLFRYHALANRETASAIAHEEAPPRAAALLAHLIAAEWLWLERLGVAREPMAVWPELAPDEVPSHLDRLEVAWSEALPSLAERGDERIRYVNSKGERWESRVEDVLTHIVFHGSHHRGQIIAALRAAGIEPPYLDFIEMTRRGKV